MSQDLHRAGSFGSHGGGGTPPPPGPPQPVPFYAAALSAAKESSLGGGRGTATPRSSVSAATPGSGGGSVAPRPANEFELPGRLFGARRRANSPPPAQNPPPPLPGQGASPSSSLLISSSALDDAPAARATGPRLAPGTTAQAGHPTGKAVEECAFFADILFMWMGVERTEYIRYNSAARQYEMAAGWGSERQHNVLATLQQCGALAKAIDDSLHRSLAETSFIQQSLRGALRRQLTQYHYLIATVRERRGAPLTLGDLVVAFKRVQPKLWAMHHILKETETVKGGEMASRLQLLVQQGSHRLSSLLADVYLETVSPLLHMAVSCTTRGEVVDPFGEFFIVADAKLDDSSDVFWTAKYRLATDMLPTTVSRAVAEDILLVTKNISFIRNCCRAKLWRMDPSIADEARNCTFKTLPAVVRDALAYSNTAVMRLLREQFGLHDVFRMVNAFLLVGYGDFYEILIDKLGPILSTLSATVDPTFVQEQVQKALQEVTPYARPLDTDRFGTLHCELAKGESRLGWDAFAVTMPLPTPLNNLFNYSAGKVYRRLFRMMFKVKVAEVALKKSWRQSVIIDRAIASLQRQRGARDMAAWREVAADAHLLGLQLNHFVTNLWSYLVAEACTVAWDLLVKGLAECRSFDDVHAVHGAYLAYLTQRCLLHNDCAAIRMNVENVITIVREFCGSQALLTSLLDRASVDAASIKRQYTGLSDDFHREVSTLLTTLEEQHLQFDFLNFLLLRLNFNRYYHDTTTSANTEF